MPLGQPLPRAGFCSTRVLDVLFVQQCLMLLVVILVPSMLALGPKAHANETDQFTMPLGKEFADLGDYFSRQKYDVLVQVVDQANARIHDALRDGDTKKAESYQSLDYLARAVYQHHGMGFHEADKLESLFRSKAFTQRYPGKLVTWRAPKWIYSGGHLPIDPRNLFIIARGSTIKVHGVYMGTDKIGHFHHVGYMYFRKAYGSDKATVEEAAQGAVRSFSKGLLSEGTVMGVMTAGVSSNADLCANYMGMKFYFNLTQPVKIKGQMRPALLIRNGPYLALADHVKPGAPLFEPFVSDHFNEALNPCQYTPGLRGHVARRLRKDRENILAFYCDQLGLPRSQAFFDSKLRELWTYYGEDYGHSKNPDKLESIGEHCFPDAPTPLTRLWPEQF